MTGRPFSEICRELADAAHAKGETVLASILRMAALDAAESGVKHDDGRLQDALVGAWDWDIPNDRLYADARFAKMFGINAEDAARGTPQKRWMGAIHPDDLSALQTAIKRALAGELFSHEYRVITDGETRWLYGRGKCTLDRGKPVRFAGAIVDITQEKIDDVSHSIAPI